MDFKLKNMGTMLGNNNVCRIEGIGSIRIQNHKGDFKLLSQVRYIPHIQRNLISLELWRPKVISLLVMKVPLRYVKERMIF